MPSMVANRHGIDLSEEFLQTEPKSFLSTNQRSTTIPEHGERTFKILCRLEWLMFDSVCKYLRCTSTRFMAANEKRQALMQ